MNLLATHSHSQMKYGIVGVFAKRCHFLEHFKSLNQTPDKLILFNPLLSFYWSV